MSATNSSPQLGSQSGSSSYAQDNTLSRIREVADEDVAMQDPPEGGFMYLVLDTNVLIHQLAVLRWFTEDIESLSLPVKIIIPSVVLSELDGLKNRDGLSWFARTASTLLLAKVKEKRSVKVQTRTETCNTPVDDPERKNDISILDCCCYFKKKGSVVLVSGDNNLCIETEGCGIPTVSPPKRTWSSRELARSLFAHHVDLARFRGHEQGPNYRPTRSAKRLGITEEAIQDDDDIMEIDDEYVAEGVEDFVPSHALDALHLQIIDHFWLVLRELAQRVRAASGDNAPPTESKHAPEYRRKPFSSWTLGDCLEYLKSKARAPLRESRPPLAVFLLRRNEARGWRRGQDWGRQDWLNALEALADVGEKFEDGSVLYSLKNLMPHVDDIFQSPMRPTGI